MAGITSTTRTIFWVTIFSIAMAYFESSVVVYLRMIYYPEGFSFPLKLMTDTALYIELGRELSTIIMLAAIGWISGRNIFERILYFFFSFGVWDIFYYVWLKVFLNWPSSLLEDDILFLIPIPWVGPVIAPVIVSVIFIGAALWGLNRSEEHTVIYRRWDLAVIAVGLLVIFISFIRNALIYDLLREPDPGFAWAVFLAGTVTLVAGIIRVLK